MTLLICLKFENFHFSPGVKTPDTRALAEQLADESLENGDVDLLPSSELKDLSMYIEKPITAGPGIVLE